MLALDFPGHGLSQFRSQCSPYLAIDYANAVVHALRGIGWLSESSSFSLVAHSMGGTWTTTTTARARLTRPGHNLHPIPSQRASPA